MYYILYSGRYLGIVYSALIEIRACQQVNEVHRSTTKVYIAAMTCVSKNYHDTINLELCYSALSLYM